ncbi:YebC/PmpR family DNA-binding transcriptional regulator [Candidatus Uhrbacteria bacterium]|nr:YebC/PmpR family DNA-binding transcriptional regulator [Candidatus Uhrbacteria bacterium]
MSGHSKWATTKRAKAVTDAKRASQFTRLAAAITIAAREKGGNPDTNFSLRLAIEKARDGNMPKDNIERAIKRGTGELGGAQLEEIMYEGYGPEGVALLISTLTDNKNRTVSEIKHTLSKHGGNLGAANSVLWCFEKKAIIGLSASSLTDERELELIEYGAEDIQKNGDETTVVADASRLQLLKEYLERQGVTSVFAEIDYLPKNTVALSTEGNDKLERIFETLDEQSDVTDYYSNRAQ